MSVGIGSALFRSFMELLTRRDATIPMSILSGNEQLDIYKAPIDRTSSFKIRYIRMRHYSVTRRRIRRRRMKAHERCRTKGRLDIFVQDICCELHNTVYPRLDKRRTAPIEKGLVEATTSNAKAICSV
ncbi:uncharacterized protein N7496_012505 [Penicillium cataractarum]|uniref:Uncharacterized protein n=1 Tax=Penicillium cataractarum TaxID=2100454 RepID=A0A9W9R854_9EURO|nr:uncharacterized protein N7496_012505 [Penicillium cataractarum]KAJ5355293.1 hypothetical protein N7496_012505 [Penicillium cataractarum]